MLILVGCNHRSAPVAFRERLAFGSEEIVAELEKLREVPGVEEAVILSTCNRVEVIVRGEDRIGIEPIKRYLTASRGVSKPELDRHVYHCVNLDAVRHLFQVAAGMDSMILGEPQILGQVKQAYQMAHEAGATGTVLERLMQQCLHAAKRIRHETGISRNAVSAAYAAVSLARQIFGKLEGRRALLIGSGKMTHLVAKHLVSHGVTEVRVTSRTFNRAERLAQRCDGRAMHWNEALGRLHEADIVVSCTAAPTTILSRDQVAQASRKRRGEPLFLIDLAVPRDVDPSVNQLDNVYLYDIDGLESVVDTSLKERRRAAAEAAHRIDREVEGFDRWRQSLEIKPTIVSLREALLGVARSEVERFRRRLGPMSAEQHQVVQEMARALVQKILHRPVVHLRQAVERGDVDATTALCRKLFGLDDLAPEEGTRRERDKDARPEAEANEPRGPQRVLDGGKD